MGYKLDDFIDQFDPPFPTHVKIDVDGIERKIVDGAGATFSDQRLKSVLIELNEHSEEDIQVMTLMKQHGFRLHRKAREESFCSKELSQVYNHIFVRP